jgi:predicted mannosyl-3-phosphoglycerate phosphatase (HAD superfamily)
MRPLMGAGLQLGRGARFWSLHRASTGLNDDLNLRQPYQRSLL